MKLVVTQTDTLASVVIGVGGIGPIQPATPTTLGSVLPGTGLVVDAYGALSVDLDNLVADAATVRATDAPTTRSLARRFAEVVNALDWATGDGATDETAALLVAALLATATGRPLILPAATYRVTSLSYPTGLVRMRGAGRGATIVMRVDNDTANRYLINSSNNTATRISDLTVDGNRGAQTFASAGIFATGALVEIERVESRFNKAAAGYGWGIYVGSSTNQAAAARSLLSDCLVHDNDGDGIILSNTLWNITVEGSDCLGNGGNGIHVLPVSPYATGQQQGVKLRGNTCNGNAKAGISAGYFNGFTSFPCQFFEITGNGCANNGSYGLVFQVDRSLALGNTLDNNGLTAALGNMLANCSNSSVVATVSFGGAGWGIDAGGAISTLVADSNIRDSTHSGINLGCGVGNAARGNRIYGALTKAIAVSQIDGPGAGGVFPEEATTTELSDNYIELTTSTQTGISISGIVPDMLVVGNVFKGGNPALYIYGGMQSGLVERNRAFGALTGFPIAAAANVVFPDYADKLRLTSASASIGQFLTNTQAATAGKLTGVKTTPGSGYTAAGTAVVVGSGGGAGATVLCELDTLGGIRIAPVAQGAGYTAATLTPSGQTGGTGFAVTAVQIGYPNAADGRAIEVQNCAGAPVTLTNGPMLRLAGGANLVLTDRSTVVFTVADSGVFYERSRAVL